MGARWIDFLKTQFDPLVECAQSESLNLARAVWGLGSSLILTTNYDKVLRWASPREREVRHWTVSDKANLVDILRGRIEKPTVWHVHGFIDRPEEIILTPDGYSMLYPADGQVQVNYEATLYVLRCLLAARTFLFVGFGMEAAIREQIAWVWETFAGSGVPHFVLVRAQEREAMEKELDGLPVQPVPFADFGDPLLELLWEMADPAEAGGGRPPAPLPRVEANHPRAYLRIPAQTYGVHRDPRAAAGERRGVAVSHQRFLHSAHRRSGDRQAGAPDSRGVSRPAAPGDSGRSGIGQDDLPAVHRE